MYHLHTLIFIYATVGVYSVYGGHSASSINPSQSGRHNDQYLQEKDDQKSDQILNEHNPYHLTNDYKMEQQSYSDWSPYKQGIYSQHNPYFNLFGYPNPIFLPYPVLFQPDFLYPYAMANDIEDPLSRANTRRPTPFRNSPIYYVRIPPTPYMFIPGLGYTSQPPNFSPNFSPIMQFNTLPTLPVQPAISPLINLPLSLVGNGKPTNIYQLDSNEIQSQYQSYTPSRPPYRPPYQSFIHDSKITHLKRPFLFNGKPDEIYVLPSNINPIQSIYQPSLQNYY